MSKFLRFPICTRKSERVGRLFPKFYSHLNDLIFLDLTSSSAPHVVYSSQYWIGQTVDKTVNPWNSTWQDGTATNYGNWNNPSQGPNNGNCTNQVCAIIMYSASSTSARPGAWDAVAQNSGYYPAICQVDAIY